MYRSHRRIDKLENEEEDGYQSFDGDLHLFENDRELDISFKLRVLADLLQCPLCHGYFRDAFTIKECLHTFCKRCIYIYVANGNSYCPVCKEMLAANIDDGIGSDRILQHLVDKLFPQFEIFEKIEKQHFYEFCNLEYSSTNHEETPPPPPSLSSSALTYETPSTPADHVADTFNSTREYFRNVLNKSFKICSQQNMAIALFPEDRNTKVLQKPYVRTASQMQVYHMMLYVANKLGVENVGSIELTLEGQVIHKTHTLEFVCKSRRLDPNKCILIKYRINAHSHKNL